MGSETQKFYCFLSACSGSWRNAVFIAAPNTPGYLLTVDRDGRPLVMAAESFQQLSGEQIDPTECCGQLAKEGFASLYAQYLLWRVPSAEQDPLQYLSESVL